MGVLRHQPGHRHLPMIPKVLASKENGDRVVDFEISEDRTKVMIGECCDGWYGEELTKAEFGEFIAELQSLHAQMRDYP